MTFELTVVLPTLNEEGALRVVLPRLRAVFARMGVRAEILVVDGHSTDKTVAVAEADGARVLTQAGRGLGDALRDGLLAADSEWTAVVDADGSHPPEFLAEMWSRRGDADLVIASRYVPGGSAVMSPTRLFLSRLLNAVSRVILDLPARDSSGAFRLYRSKLARGACSDSSGKDFTVQQELLVGVLARGGRVVELPFRFEPRLDGASKASILRLAPAYFLMLIKLWSARRRAA